MLNHVTIQGRNVREMELKQTQSGIDNLIFTIAWSEKYKEIERKCFLKCKAWRQTAQFLDKYFHDKGAEMLLEGALETEEWTDKDGNKRSQVILNVDKVHFCGKKQTATDGQGSLQSAGIPVGNPADLPF